MSVLLNREVRRLFVVAGVLALALVLVAQVVVRLATEDYKRTLIAHDAGIAGALVLQGMAPTAAAAIFTAPSNEEARATGELALARAGVTEQLSYRFLPEAQSFLRRYGVAAFVVSVLFVTTAIVGLWLFFARLERRVGHATEAIERFMRAQDRGGGQRAVFGLAAGSLAEGSAARLLSAIDSMAASLTAHLQSEQQSRDFLKDTISDISHQLRTPLAALRLFTEIIRDEEPTNPVIADFVLKCEHELSHMEYLIQNLLVLARLDAGAISLERSAFALAALLGDVLAVFSVRAEAEGKQVRLHCPDEVTLVGDRHWLAEAIGNLVKNAFDHTSAGGLVQVTCEDTPLMVTIAVQDDGAGIHPEDLPHVFKRFYRSRFSQDRQGVGIGLTLARGIVEQHGGSIVVESEPGQGATFRIILPKLTDL